MPLAFLLTRSYYYRVPAYCQIAWLRSRCLPPNPTPNPTPNPHQIAWVVTLSTIMFQGLKLAGIFRVSEALTLTLTLTLVFIVSEAHHTYIYVICRAVVHMWSCREQSQSVRLSLTLTTHTHVTISYARSPRRAR